MKTKQLFLQTKAGSAMAIAVALAALNSTSFAALITWQTPAIIDVTVPTQVLSGSVFAASGATAQTVNTVVFNNALASFTISSGAGGGFGPVVPGADPDYYSVINGGRHQDSGSNATTTLSGLTFGQAYEVQVFTPYWDNEFETLLISGINTVALGNTGAVPTYVSGLFTADAITQTFDWGANTGSDSGLIAAVNVVAVPEPSSAAMLLVGGLGTLALLRRRRALI